ncbi:MAG: hypothetical protein EOP47_01525 [Sphingobacteriaceae bacterium]|nr:MAG: hypothetical protein EOP47_01525 [Sphingobacteriaceae bacterium]
MKKILSILFVAVLAIGLSSCKKTYITPNPNRTIIYDVPVSSWVLSNDGKSYYAILDDLPEIDSYFNENGGVLIYFNFNQGVYEQAPYTFNNVAYSYTHETGNIVLYAQTPNGVTPVLPSAMKVKIILIDSDQ